LTQWGIDSVFTITVDNASANDVRVEYMRKMMKNKSHTVLGGEFLHMRCAAHIKDCIEREKIKCKNMVCLDIPTRWNSTYLMLGTVEKYQRAFDLLGEDGYNHFVVP
jgi:hypothetical protein